MKNQQISEYLKSEGFRIENQESSEYFGDKYEVLSSGNIDLIFSSVKSIQSISIRRNEGKKEEFDLALVKNLILEEESSRLPIPIEEIEQFLMNNLSEIKELFSKRRFKETKTKLNKLGDERAKQMFPGARNRIK